MRAWLIPLALAAVAAHALDPPLTRYAITSPAGYRQSPIGGVADGETLHEGVDLFGPLGCDVLAAGNGVVTEATMRHPVYGGMVVIDHGGGIWTRVGHLRAVSVVEGERVVTGQVVGKQGNTGRSDGEHTHFAVIPDPLLFFPAPIGLSDKLRKELLR